MQNNRENLGLAIAASVVISAIAALIYSTVQCDRLSEQLEDLRDHVLMMQLRVDQLDGMDV